MKLACAVAGIALLWPSWVNADGALPPRLELQNLTMVYVDCRALVGEQGSPALLITAEVSDQFCPAVIAALSGAGVRVSRESQALLPQVRAWVDIVRNPSMAGVVAVGVHVAFSDLVRLRRLPKVSPVEQGELWRRDTVGLITEDRLAQELTRAVGAAVQEFVDDVRCANDERCRAGVD